MRPHGTSDYSLVLRFWLEETPPSKHWQRSAAFDNEIRARFGLLHQAAMAGELDHWRTAAEGRLAEVIVLDQFSRNLFRDDARAWAGDGMALVLAQEAVNAGLDQTLPINHRVWFYMPYMHSESRSVHAAAEALFGQPGLSNTASFEVRHRAIIERFGRYPHRNEALGRVSTPEEIAFLQSPGSSF